MSQDNIFGVHSHALLLKGERSKLIASNLANADTPNYKSRDIDFKAVLRGEYEKNLPMTVTHAIHLDNVIETGAETLYRVPMQPSIDGNTVDTQMEQAEFAENTLQYEASLRFLNGRISGLMTAIKGE